MTVNVDSVYYGLIADMVAEVGAHEMPQDWLDQNNFKFAVMPVGDVQFDTQFCVTIEEAKACAGELAAVYSVKMVRV